MATVTTINSGDLITNSRAVINNNFAALNTDKIETSYLDTDTTLAANSDTKLATQKAVKTYVDAVASPTGKSWNEYAVDAVGTDSYAITLTGFTAYVAGQTFKFRAATANTGTCTLNVNGLGAITIKKNVSTDLVTGDILANQVVTVIYDGTNMQIVGVPTTHYKSGATTYNTATASGSQTIAHGMGVIPTVVKITGTVVGSADIGMTFTAYSNGTQASCYLNGTTGTGTTEFAGATFRLQPLDTGYAEGVITVDATNITISWTKTGSPTGTAYLVWEAQY